MQSQVDTIVEQIAQRIEAHLTDGEAPTPQDGRALVAMGAAHLEAGPGHEASAADLAPFIDHTLLRADATGDELKKLCEEAHKYGFATVCVNAGNVRYCATLLEGSRVKPIAVVGFPLGAGTPLCKAFEAREAVHNGAQEIDMVINLGALKSLDYALVFEDIAAVVQAAAPRPVKVILETGLLDQDQKVVACVLSKAAGAAFVKTSTGFGPGGASAEDIMLMRRVVGAEMGVKASGGVRTEDDVRNMLAAGANRIGASASVAIVTGASKSTSSEAKPRKLGGY
jgi:deoxyribose-phosphate aldolase